MSPYKDPSSVAARASAARSTARYRAANPEKARASAARSQPRWKARKIEALAGRPRPEVCDYCGSDNGGRPMEFDHDHACCPTKYPVQTCGRCFRAWLCHLCNVRDVMASMPVPYMIRPSDPPELPQETF